jgi:hypothetical protein
MGNAFDKAMSTLDDRRSELVIRELIAKRIIRIVQSGEDDAELLCASALSGIQKGPRELIIHNKTPLERRSLFHVANTAGHGHYAEI